MGDKMSEISDTLSADIASVFTQLEPSILMAFPRKQALKGALNPNFLNLTINREKNLL